MYDLNEFVADDNEFVADDHETPPVGPGLAALTAALNQTATTSQPGEAAVVCLPPAAEAEDGDAEPLVDANAAASVVSQVQAMLRDGSIKLPSGKTAVPSRAESHSEYLRELVRLREIREGVEKPSVQLPGGANTYTETAQLLAPLLAATLRYFRRGSEVVQMVFNSGHASLEPIKDAQWPTIFEQVAKLEKATFGRKGPVSRPAVCSVESAKVITHADGFKDALPMINVVSRCPVLVEKNGRLQCITGYDADTGIWADGQPPADMPLDEAVQLLTGVLADFNFATPSDQSRAIAALITPALTLGGLIPGPSAVDAGEADEPQTGKGYRNKIAAAIYNHTVHVVTQNSKGVGSLEESFSTAVLRGASFIALDNLRGKIESQMLESFLTEDTATLRIPYREAVTINPRRTVVMMTSNQSEFSPDLAKRCSIVRIRKHADDYVFKSYAEGDIVAHVKANQTRYFGAVAAVIKAWHAAEKPMPATPGHDFRAWASILNWIVTNVFKSAPLLDGHKEAQKRTTSNDLGWLRLVALAVKQEGQCGNTLRAHDLLTIMQTHQGIEIPGLADDDDLSDDDVRTKVLQTIGRKLGNCFKRDQSITIDDITILRASKNDPVKGRDTKEYVFTRSNAVILAEAGLKPQ